MLSHAQTHESQHARRLSTYTFTTTFTPTHHTSTPTTHSHTCSALVMGDSSFASISCFRPSSRSPGMHNVPIALSAPSLYADSSSTKRASLVTASASVAACWRAGDPLARVARVVGTSSCRVESSSSLTRTGRMVSSDSWGWGGCMGWGVRGCGGQRDGGCREMGGVERWDGGGGHATPCYFHTKKQQHQRATHVQVVQLLLMVHPPPVCCFRGMVVVMQWQCG